jgi:hypothetical protein
MNVMTVSLGENRSRKIKKIYLHFWNVWVGTLHCFLVVTLFSCWPCPINIDVVFSACSDGYFLYMYIYSKSLCSYTYIINKKKFPSRTLPCSNEIGINLTALNRQFIWLRNSIGGVMVSVLASSAVDRGFEPKSGQTKDYIKLVCVASPLSMQH